RPGVHGRHPPAHRRQVLRRPGRRRRLLIRGGVPPQRQVLLRNATSSRSPTLPGVPRPRSRLLALAACAASAAVLLGGCRVDATVEARVQGAGGTVTARVLLDREAVALLGGPITDGAQTSDLHR